MGEINQKVDTLSAEVEKTQERVRKNEVRIDDVDKQAQAGISDAKGSAQQALKRATEAERAAKGKLIYTVTLSNDKVTFPVNRAAVSDDARSLVDEAIAQLDVIVANHLGADPVVSEVWARSRRIVYPAKPRKVRIEESASEPGAAAPEEPGESHAQPQPGEKTAQHKAMLLFRGLLASSRTGSVPGGACTRGRFRPGEGATREL